MVKLHLDESGFSRSRSVNFATATDWEGHEFHSCRYHYERDALQRLRETPPPLSYLKVPSAAFG